MANRNNHSYNTRSGGERRKSYIDDEKFIPCTKKSATTVETWKEGWYPVETSPCHKQPGYVKIHYKGWDKKYDEIRLEEEIRTTYIEPNLQIFKISIKECLRGGHQDSKIIIRQPMQEESFELLRECAVVLKVTRNRTVYKLTHRQQFDRILGCGWDYRIVNDQADSFFIKTETVRFWYSKRKVLLDYLAFPDHVEPHYLERGHQLVFTFVKCPGNVKHLPDLLNKAFL